MGIFNGDGMIGAMLENAKKKKQTHSLLQNKAIKAKLNQAGWEDSDLRGMDSDTLETAINMSGKLESVLAKQDKKESAKLENQIKTSEAKKKAGLLGITKIEDRIQDTFGTNDTVNDGMGLIQQGVGQLDDTQKARLDSTIKGADGIDAIQTALSTEDTIEQVGVEEKVVQEDVKVADKNAEDPRLAGLSRVGTEFINEKGDLVRTKSPFQIENEAIEADRISATKSRAKLDAAMTERLAGAQKATPGTVRQLRLFGQSMEELEAKIPRVGDEGFGGWLARAEATVRTSMDEFPVTRALNIRAEIAANQQARDIEGGRVTDADRKIYAMGMANAMREPSETNAVLASESLMDLMDKYGNELGSFTNILIQYSNSDQKIFQNIAAKVLENHPEMIADVYGEGATIVEE